MQTLLAAEVEAAAEACTAVDMQTAAAGYC
jgi:hypothetical protein